MSDVPTDAYDRKPDKPELREPTFYLPLSLVVDMNKIGATSRGKLFTAITDYYFIGKMPDEDELPAQAYEVFSTYLTRLRKARAQNKQRDAKSYDELRKRERARTLEYERQLAEWERNHPEGNV